MHVQDDLRTTELKGSLPFNSVGLKHVPNITIVMLGKYLGL